MIVYVYGAGAVPGAALLAQGTLTNQLANSFDVTIPGAPGLVVNNNYTLAVGGQLQNNDQHKNGYANPAQLLNVNGNVYTFTV